ncbi:MAG: hypothetical protein KatS3mg109_1092 [Pirellulaceae bacterium]|nr:MAG: hypothetical protein KatS3mg109_1051 [Pirellulaceae bacterium]GIW90660.1 MAG: hypothetical protein KatS3mg109_1092 [Pirellulaceae bacterium]GIW93655.1 MAG: hypothetical protein KatS3mg110_1696 [Pirellulaceae bacterium]
MAPLKLSASTRKALAVHIGEQAGQELAELLMELIRRVEELERKKVDVTSIVPEERRRPASRSTR